MPIIRKEFFYPAANGSHPVYGCFWLEEGRKEFLGILQIAHGMAEHILRYEAFAVFLAKKGYIICGNDHQGHGRTCPNLAEYGFFGERGGVQALLADLRYMMNFMKARYPGLPYFLLGHSMGSFLSRKFVVQYGWELSGAAFLGTSGGNPLIDLAVFISGWGIRLKGPKKKGHIVNKLAFVPFNAKFYPAETDFDWLSRDKREVRKFMKDPKCGFVFSHAGYRDLFLLLKEISSEEWAYRVPKELPFLVMSGTDDPVGDFGHGARAVAKRLREAGCRDVRLKLYNGARHEVLHETNRGAVFVFLYHWLCQHQEGGI